LKVRDIDIPNVEMIDPASTPVVGVARARAAIVATVDSEEIEGEEGEEGAEGSEGSEATAEAKSE